MLRRNAIKQYKNVQVKTASPGEVLLMLYDGLFRFLREAREAMAAKKIARAGDRLDRAFAIVSELAATLRPEVAPDLCNQLGGIYNFCMDHIVAANLAQDPAKLDEIIEVLTPIREGFREAVQASSPAHIPVSPPSNDTKAQIGPIVVNG